MIKVFLIAIFSPMLLLSSQILLVISNDFNTSKAKLSAYENSKKVFENIDVNIGKNGLGWGLGVREIPHKKSEPIKMEGDKKAPAGIFQLGVAFGYQKQIDLKLPYLYADDKLLCVDDVDSKFYNRFVNFDKGIQSFEHMKRDDEQYKYGLTVVHNQQQIKKRGSCIFLHIQKSPNHPTVGCTSMKEKDLLKILKWLDKDKNPILIQVPKLYLNEVYKLYPELKKD
ncbi:L,D-transpeptidase family protein [Sulfurimonas sp. C5]|uniref:L,D-transpeptidase family protein n=1 Tax=Sulfurimonas sp. C5 TaxID=3036947 RepID=UPI002456D13F|nr:L,D-transpeptidase family protein [Sulfurimonas sp. C5]MDH4945259.1 L,D-transpeptidase family protein [Sulfurimonas sp. C5]